MKSFKIGWRHDSVSFLAIKLWQWRVVTDYAKTYSNVLYSSPPNSCLFLGPNTLSSIADHYCALLSLEYKNDNGLIAFFDNPILRKMWFLSNIQKILPTNQFA